MLRPIEKKIRLNAVLIYLTVAFVCISLIYYTYSLRKNIQSERKSIEQYIEDQERTNELIRSINLSQAEANLYLVTKRSSHLKLFRQYSYEVESCIDSLINEQPDNISKNEILKEIVELLRKKEKTITELNKHLADQNLIDSIQNKLGIYESSLNNDSIILTTIVQNTIINTPQKKGFWKRVSNVFSPDSKQDTIISTSQIDTVLARSNNPDFIAEVSNYAERAASDYNYKIYTIEKQLRNLILVDQEISAGISDLLIDLSSYTILSRLENIEESENRIQKNNLYTIFIGIFVLVLILIFILLIIHDVNKGYRARIELLQANERIRQIMESRHKMLLSMSHDIKTPLNSILGSLEISKSEKKLDEQTIAAMENAGKHVLTLLENLLEYSSIEQGMIEEHRSYFNLNELCLESIELFTPIAAKKHLLFKYDLNFEDNLFVLSDKLKIKQILLNILSNAFKYTVEGEVTLVAVYENNRLSFEISDSGIGIPEEELVHIFEAFTRIDRNKNMAEGSGLGMYIVKSLVELMKGTINVQSDINKGTTVLVELPVQIKLLNNNPNTPKNILIIDDDVTFLNTITTMFEHFGHKVTKACTLEDFEKMVKRISDLDLVITDLDMGAFSGETVLRTIRKINPHIQVILMTGQTNYDLQKAFDKDFDGFLKKPASLKDIAFLLSAELIPGKDSFLLEDIFGDDKETIKKITDTFITSTKEHIRLLQEAIQKDDFPSAQAVCHKMLPMFMQIGAKAIIPVLKKIDASRNLSKKDYPDWKKDIAFVMKEAEIFIKGLEEKYNNTEN